MASTSSLLRSAESTRQKVRDYEDALAAYEWQNSTKTYGDFVAYSRYLQDQQASVSSPMDQLSYVKKIDAARSGYVSNEIQRQSISVIEGGGTNIDKYNRMLSLHYYAQDEGQFDLAQSLRLQLDNLSVTIQNESRAALAANKEMASEVAKDIDIQVKDAAEMIKSNAKAVLEEYSKIGPDQFLTDYNSDIFSMLAGFVNSVNPDGTPNYENPGLVQIYQQAAESTPDAAKIREYQGSLDGLANGKPTGIELPGAGAISYKDLTDQAYANSIGQSLFDTIVTGKGVQFSRKQTTGYAWGRDEYGEYGLMPIYNAEQKLESSIQENGKNKSYNDVLKGAGFELVGNGEGNIKVRNNGEFDNAGIARGQQVELYIDLNGNLQLINGKKAYSLGFDQKTGNYTGINAYEANPINLLTVPGGDGRFGKFNNRYTGGKDLGSLPAGTIGLVDTTSPIARSMEAGPLARPQFNPQQAAPLQQPAPVNIQPTAPAPVQAAINPLGLPASTRISIAKPLPLPNLKVVKPAPAPNVSVAAPQPQQQISGVGVAPSGGTLRVGF